MTQLQYLLLKGIVTSPELAHTLSTRNKETSVITIKLKYKVIDKYHSDYETTADCFIRRQPRGLHPVGALSSPPLENYGFYTPTVNVERLWSMDHHGIPFDKYAYKIYYEQHLDSQTSADWFSQR